MSTSHLAVFYQEKLVAVFQLGSKPLTLGPTTRLEGAPLAPPLSAGSLRVDAFGQSAEVSADAGVELHVNGTAARRKRLRTGDVFTVGVYTIHFLGTSVESDAPPTASVDVHRRWLEAVAALARHSQKTLDSREFLERIMDCLLSVSGAERGFVLLRSEDGTLTPAVSRKLDPSRTDTFSRTFVDGVLSTGKSATVGDAAADPALKRQQSVVAGKIRSVIAVPLFNDGQVHGVVYLDSQASHHIFSPTDVEVLESAAEHVMAILTNFRNRQQLVSKATRLERMVEHEVGHRHDLRHIVGSSPAFRQAMDTIRKVAVQSTSTLLLGESGTGKELMARAIHDLSTRRSGPFVAVNCMALSTELLESELFGHEKGAFTGANETKPGRFEMADGGTIFLDEIGELDQRTQVKLLRVLQENTIERVGSNKTHRVNTRLVCATHVDLEQAIAKGTFREDLYYRIAVFPITLPPLRNRREDIPGLAQYFVESLSRRMGRDISGISPAALRLLEGYSWPGNIRELRNVIERALVLESENVIGPDSLPLPMNERRRVGNSLEVPIPSGGGLAAAREIFEKTLILACLEKHKNKVLPAAKELRIPRSTIYRKLIAWGIASSDVAVEK